MYTQSTKSGPKSTNVVSFPNTESIARMKAISTKENSVEMSKTANKNTEKANESNDLLLLLALTLTLSDNKPLGADIFCVIAGIILTL